MLSHNPLPKTLENRRVIVLDHHKTAVDMLGSAEAQHPNLLLELDMSRSGATIALDWFQPKASSSLIGLGAMQILMSL